ncbi:cation:dicarboxylase symporter family transporter [Halosquirtibacter laminarini]|uniref:Cation:dicarboxylase symporter family transporter n=1 Tax=Halosquirtibacter laminarini TaxID=3374600 RepID=A0AC61NI99_9BACT|nr:cation:dicarboxylase symporter family transporter [Prolixibacteraceae bacterium]
MLSIYVCLAIFVALLYLLKTFSVKRVKFHYRNLIAICLGVLFGWAIYRWVPQESYKELVYYFKTVSNLYIRGLKLMIVPIVFISICYTLVKINDQENIGKKFRQIITYFVASVLGAGSIALVMSKIFNFPALIQVDDSMASHIAKGYSQRIDALSDASIGKVVYGLTQKIPTSIFDGFASNNIVGTLVVALLVGLAIRKMQKKKPQEMQRAINALSSLQIIINSMTTFIIKWTPYGVLSLMTMAVAKNGPSLFGDLLQFVGIAYLTMAFIFAMHLIVLSFRGVKPWEQLKGMLPALITGFSTQSSGATLPVTIKCLEENRGVDAETASLTASLGTTMGMNACGAMWPVFMIVLATGVNNQMGLENIDLTSVASIISMLLAVVISSFGIAGLPGTASFAAITAMTIMGVSPQVMGVVLTFVLSIDSLIDMGRTATNIFGVSSAATFISRGK